MGGGARHAARGAWARTTSTARWRAMDELTAPLQDWVTRYAWGDVWNRPGLARRDRSILNIGMLVALNRPHELRLHLRGALRNGRDAGRDPRVPAAERRLLRRAGGAGRLPHRPRGAGRGGRGGRAGAGDPRQAGPTGRARAELERIGALADCLRRIERGACRRRTGRRIGWPPSAGFIASTITSVLESAGYGGLLGLDGDRIGVHPAALRDHPALRRLSWWHGAR